MTIRQRQHLLGYLGYYSAEADGIWGPKSREAALRFQQDFGGLTADGSVETDTEEALKRAVAEGMPERQSDDFWQEIRYFTREEFRCKCGGRFCEGYPAEMKRMAVVIADRARAYFGAPGHVVSGLRCRQHNANSGGVENSQHMSGEAVDLRIDGVGADALLAYVKQQPEVRYAYKINSTNVHFDIPREAG